MRDNQRPKRATDESALRITLPGQPQAREISIRRRDGSLLQRAIPFYSAADASAAQDEALARDPTQGAQCHKTFQPPVSQAKDAILDRRDSAMMEAPPKTSSASQGNLHESTATSFSDAEPTSRPSIEFFTESASSIPIFPGLRPGSTLSTLDSTPRTSVTPGLRQGPNKKKRRRQDDLSIDGVGLNPLDETPQYRHLAIDGKWYTDATIPAGRIPSWALQSELIENDASKSRSKRASRRSREYS